jgi:hypothetical protein
MNNNNCDLEKIRLFIERLSPESQQQLAHELFRLLPVEQKAKLIQSELADAGMTVVFGGSNKTTTDICINIYNSKELEVDKILDAVGNWVKIKRERGG